MNRTLFQIFCAGLVLSSALGAEQPKPAPPADCTRFLFVVDISSRMHRLDFANRQTIFDLVYFGINHQMRSGDTFGIWTFNEKVYPGEFSMQQWEPKANLEVASRAATFLKSKSYSGKSDLDPPIMAMGSLVRAVKDVNIFLLSDGETPVKGTPFDPLINGTYQKRSRDQRKADKPFITTFVVRAGAITAASVTLPGEDITLPARPEESLAKKKTDAKATNDTQVAKQDLGRVLNQKPVDSDPSQVPPRPVSNRPPLIITKSSWRAIVDSNLNAVAAAAAVPMTNISESKLSSNPPVVEDRTNAGKNMAASPDNASNQQHVTKQNSNESTPEGANANAQVVTQVLAHDGENGPLADSKPVPEAKSQQDPSSPEAPATYLGPGNKHTPLLPQPIKAAAREMGGVSSPLEITPAARPFLNPQLLILAGSFLLGGAFMLLLMVYRRVRKLPESSFITRSMERH